MDHRAALESARAGLLDRISEAARSTGDSTRVVELSRDLERVDASLRQIEAIEVMLQAIDTGKEGGPSASHASNGGHASSVKPKLESSVKPKLERPSSAKAAGERRRQEFVERARHNGVDLEPLGRVLYRSPRGSVVAIASASERAPNRWFLGLPAGSFDTAVLLCEDGTGFVHEFVIDESAFAVYGDDLSCDDRGQIKFNVMRKNGRFLLRIPHRGSVELHDGDLRALSPHN